MRHYISSAVSGQLPNVDDQDGRRVRAQVTAVRQ
jgi:hypothetical protein